MGACAATTHPKPSSMATSCSPMPVRGLNVVRINEHHPIDRCTGGGLWVVCRFLAARRILWQVEMLRLGYGHQTKCSLIRMAGWLSMTS